MDSLQGKFLIASPQLQDANFFQSVVLMIEHHDEGALGIIINRQTHFFLRDVWPDSETASACDVCVSVGGPVEGPMISLHWPSPIFRIGGAARRLRSD